MKNILMRISSFLLTLAVLTTFQLPIRADGLEDFRNFDSVSLPSGNGGIRIYNYVVKRQETLNINATEYTIPVYYVDDMTTITFQISSDKVVGDISKTEWANGTYNEYGDLYLGDTWGWPTLNTLSLLDGVPLRGISITDLSDPISIEDHRISYASVGIYIRNIADLGTSPDNIVFSDVAAGAYYADAVNWAVDKKITTGTSTTTFSPNNTCTTAQILTFLWRANGSPAPAGSNAAVPAGQYYTDAANWALEKGLTDAFTPDAPATRAATVTYLWKLAGKPAADAAAFADVDAGAEYAQAVAWAVKEGITTGTSTTTFDPDSTCTRGQIVTFLHRSLA